MKKIIMLIGLIFCLNISTAQSIKFIDEEYGMITVGIDPSATVKEKSPNLYASLELVSYWKYVNLNMQFLPDLQGGYLDYGGSFGLNLTSGYFSEMRYYSGVRMGMIKRGFNADRTYTYPLIGFEGGVTRKLSNKIVVGVRATGDYRSDFKILWC
jgi:hypothetical protein